MKRACLEPGCPLLTTRTRCFLHTRAKDKARVAKRGTLYQGDYRKRRAATIAAQPWCSDCGRTTDLTADHIVAGQEDSPLRTLCRSCNSARANRARARAQRVGGR
jgi:5-methylcytosine-specific restriction endonuclease McrA